jgi:hypothetical protein
MNSDRSSAGSIVPYIRRGAAAVIALTLLALVLSDLEIAQARGWWDRHSLTGSVVASLLVLGVTALIFDEVIARHQRRERASTVAVQGLILYSQARRAYGAVLAGVDAASGSSNASEEMRPLASMLLTASPSLFDDPVARVFLERLQRLMGSLLQTLAAAPARGQGGDQRAPLMAEMAQLQASIEPLRARLPAEYRSLFDEP